MGKTTIQWTEHTWNPLRGCSVVSEGCVFCYAMKQAHRFSGPGKAFEGLTKLGGRGPIWTGEVRMVPEALAIPLRTRKPTTWFVNSMSDLFHEDVPNEYIAAVFGVMAACPQHTFQVLTKRAEWMAQWFGWFRRALTNRISSPLGQLSDIVATRFADDHPIFTALFKNATNINAILSKPLPNVWLGVSVESQRHAEERIPHLLEMPAAVRFLSVEPQVEAVALGRLFYSDGPCQERGIDWVIQGGESGPGARPFDLAWARSMREQCKAAGVAYFLKQVSRRPIDGGRVLQMKDSHGGDMSEWPEDLRVRQMPEVRR